MSSSWNLFSISQSCRSLPLCLGLRICIFFFDCVVCAAPKAIIFTFPTMCNEGMVSHFTIGSSAPMFSHIFLEVLRKAMRRPSQDPNPKHSWNANLIWQQPSSKTVLVIFTYIPPSILSQSMRVTSPPTHAHRLINTLRTLLAVKLTDLKGHTSL